MGKRGFWIIPVTCAILLLTVSVANAAAIKSPLNYSGNPRTGYYCSESDPTNHPVGETLASEFGATYEDVMNRFCQEGYGFGEIMLAYSLAQQSGNDVSTIFGLRETGSGWGAIMKSLGLHGMSGKTVVTTTTTTSTVLGTPAPSLSNGNGNGQGNGLGNGNGNGQGNGKAKGKNK